VRGDWEFCHTGDLPIIEGVAEGQDPVLIVAPTLPHDAAFLMARRDITKPEQLANGASAASMHGQFGRPFRYCWRSGACRRRGFPRSFQAIYKALGAGRSTPVICRSIFDSSARTNSV